MRDLVAVGDSITNGHGDSMAGVPALGWGQWVADAGDLSYTRYGRGGATSAEVAAELVPRVRGRYSIALVSVGTNDNLRRVPLADFTRQVHVILERMRETADRVAILTVPASTEFSDAIRSAAQQTGSRH